MSNQTNPEVQHAARDLLGHHNKPGGYVPGGFRSKLFDLWVSADRKHSIRLSAAFPEVAPAIEALSTGGFEALTALAYPESAGRP